MTETKTFRYALFRGSKKWKCPGCGQKSAVLYLDAETGQLLPDHVARCDRENNCGYHFTPKEYFDSNPDSRGVLLHAESKRVDVPGPVGYLPFEVMEKSVSRHKQCNLYPFLERLFREVVATELCQNYFIGANKDRNTVFWQVNQAGKVCQAKVMVYDAETGRRNKQTGANFAGKMILDNQEANLSQCFFGEYLLSMDENVSKPVAIVESEKTAVIASIFYPDFIWIATGGKYGAKWTEGKVCKVLSGRKVILFPDLGAFESWQSKGLLLAAVANCRVAVSDILERNATEEEHQSGLDIADYLLKNEDSSGLALTDHDYPVIWDLKRNRESFPTEYEHKGLINKETDLALSIV